MKIASRDDASLKSIRLLADGSTFVAPNAEYYAKVNPGIHVPREYAWGVCLVDGLLTKFGPDTPVREAPGEFVPA